ncbi:unnamed protein product, partial [Amoebophrya sp. A120]
YHTLLFSFFAIKCALAGESRSGGATYYLHINFPLSTDDMSSFSQQPPASSSARTFSATIPPWASLLCRAVAKAVFSVRTVTATCFG